MPTISLYKWAKREGLPLSTVYWLQKNGKLPCVRKEKVYYEVPDDITKEDLVKG